MKYFMATAAAGLLAAGPAAAVVDFSSQNLFGPSDHASRADTVARLRSAAAIIGRNGASDDTLRAGVQSISVEEVDLWTSILRDHPDALNEEKLLSQKPAHKIKKRPASDWEHIIHGADLAALTTKAADGTTRRQLDGDLSPYSLRARSVDLPSLGVDTVKQYSGYLDDNDNDKHLFYWFFESRGDPENDPVVLWLNGGPGCSSMTGLFMELGPSMIGKNREPVFNKHSWNENANVIFIDQPVNSGFSYSGSSVSNTVAAGKDIYALLTLFFEKFPKYAKQDFHIAGESYAGHYIPVFASEILSHKNRNINLKSLLIGNGLTDPLTQYPHYRPMACGKGGWPAVLAESECKSMDSAIPRCLSLIESCYSSESVWTCVPATIYCNNAIIGPYSRTGQNVYDVRSECKNPPLCYEEMDWINEFLNRKEVMNALGVEVDSFESCNFDVNRNFVLQGDWMKPYHRVVPGLLKEIDILVYAGDTDFICNWLGNEAWVEALDWEHKAEYNRSPVSDLLLSSSKTKYGEVRHSNNLAFMRIYAAGHMVPYDQPEASLDFYKRWLSGEWRTHSSSKPQPPPSEGKKPEAKKPDYKEDV